MYSVLRVNLIYFLKITLRQKWEMKNEKKKKKKKKKKET